jgi:3-mercaptopyruvate sulfurtransferase SseA
MSVRLILQALALCAVGAALGLAGNGFTPRPAALGARVTAAAEAPGAFCQLSAGQSSVVPRISVENATPLCTACSALFVDARSAAEYQAGHITGAIHLAAGEPVDPVLWRLGVYKTVIVYDRDPSCAVADQVAKAILERGARDVRVLTGAWPAWMAAGAPGSSGPCTACGEHAQRGTP